MRTEVLMRWASYAASLCDRAGVEPVAFHAANYSPELSIQCKYGEDVDEIAALLDLPVIEVDKSKLYVRGKRLDVAGSLAYVEAYCGVDNRRPTEAVNHGG